MRNMSFMLTTPQMRTGTKSVTRRQGWTFLKPGDRLMACEKCQGLGKGGKIVKIRVIEVTTVEREPLREMIQRPWRGKLREAELEGFPELTACHFTRMFCEHMNCTLDDVVTRVAFKFIGECL